MCGALQSQPPLGNRGPSLEFDQEIMLPKTQYIPVSYALLSLAELLWMNRVVSVIL